MWVFSNIYCPLKLKVTVHQFFCILLKYANVFLFQSILCSATFLRCINRSFVSYRTRFYQDFSYIIQLRQESSRKKLCNFIIRNFTQLSLLIRSIVLCLHIEKNPEIFTLFSHGTIGMKITRFFRCTET